jgi:hypothetical protein
MDRPVLYSYGGNTELEGSPEVVAEVILVEIVPLEEQNPYGPLVYAELHLKGPILDFRGEDGLKKWTSSGVKTELLPPEDEYSFVDTPVEEVGIFIECSEKAGYGLRLCRTTGQNSFRRIGMFKSWFNRGDCCNLGDMIRTLERDIVSIV